MTIDERSGTNITSRDIPWSADHRRQRIRTSGAGSPESRQVSRGATLARRIIRRTAARLIPGAGLIIAYHRIGQPEIDPWSLSVSPAHFNEHLEAIADNWDSIRQRDVQSALSKVDRWPFVAVTFDDGYRDNLSLARPLLERHDVRATVFLTTSKLEANSPYWWDELADLVLGQGTPPAELALNNPPRTFSWRSDQNADANAVDLLHRVWTYMRTLSQEGREKALATLATQIGRRRVRLVERDHISVAEVPDLADGTLVELGSHSLSHPYLPALARVDQEREIASSKAYLEERASREIVSFAYPFGAYDDTSIDLVERSGYANASSVEGTVVRRRSNPFKLPRLHMSDCDGDEFLGRLRKRGLRTRATRTRAKDE